MSQRLDELYALVARTAGVAEWIVIEERRLAHARALPDRGRRTIDDVRLAAVLWLDLGGGRGGTRVELGDGRGDPAARLAEAVARARHTLGPSWRLPAPAAPARVAIADPAIERDPAAALDSIEAALGTALPSGARVVDGEIAVERHTRAVRSSRGFAAEQRGTRAALSLALGPALAAPSSAAARALAAGATAGAPVRFARRARRLSDLDLPAALASAAAIAARAATATPLAPGRYDLVLPARALATAAAGADDTTRDPRGFGAFAPLVLHADGGRVRLGLSRLPPGHRLAPPGAADPLTIVSDGAHPFGWHSAPFGELGEPVRRFDLVRDGVVAGPSLDLAEAALRDAQPTGGIRDLVISPGTSPSATLERPGSRPLVIADDLLWLDCDPTSGVLALELGQARLLDGPRERAVHGGTLAGDALALLASARRSRELTSVAWLHAPRTWRLDDVPLS